MAFLLDRLKTRALELGFNIAGVTRAEQAPTLHAYLRWIDSGMHGAMAYMARPDRQERRRDLNVILPGAQSMIVAGLDYRTIAVSQDILNDPARGRIAAYAWGLDYHDIMKPRLEELAAWLCEEARTGLSHRVYVDTGAVLERAHGQQAGLGFTGKNTMLIHPRRGSYFFLGEIITDLEFDAYDLPARDTMCGRCTRCLTACPTDAFPEPFVLDARRCISYWTIEHKDWIDPDIRALMGNWVFGCDICQDVCPWQRFSVPASEAALYPINLERAAPALHTLLRLDQAGFEALYKGTPVYRIGRDRLTRNACVAAGNSGQESLAPELAGLLADRNPLIRGHAAWALARLLAEHARPLLAAAMDRETDSRAWAEIARVCMV